MKLSYSLAFLCLLTSAGCATFSSSPLSFLHYKDQGSPADSKGDPWVQAAGEETRREHAKEEVNDPLGLRNIFMSEQARSIERNVGVGD